MKTNTLKVPGATLYYEIRGTGPVLLLICGGIYDAAGFAGLAAHLTDHYTVVTYDRRGNSRSPLDGPAEPQSIEVHSDDAHRLLSEIGVTAEEPAYVFGNSSGAMIGLELATRHPEQLQVLVAHEPPVFDLLPDRDHWRTVMRNVQEAFDKEGPGAAGQVFTTALRMNGGEPDAERGAPDQETIEMMGRMEKNFVFFIGYEVPPFSGYVPDLTVLAATKMRVVLAAGEASKGEPPDQAARAIADRLGPSPTIFPGDHGGFGSEHEAFAAKLHEVLTP